ncbi:MAG TPA: TIGR03936 family radical SAM-associated protein [Dehalococcoidia bacterium]|jgi:radical SAM-linked protein|nr:TIGR03936 family radical SAM-associated protein [Dehalococcoidia bacterium]
MKVQRLRVRYSLGPEARGLGQRDLALAWGDVLKAAGLPLSYSEGRRRSAQLAIGAPLPQGVTSDCELMDAVMESYIPVSDILTRISPYLPAGIHALSIEEVGINLPSLQSQVRWAEYEVRLDAGVGDHLREAICRTLEATTLPSEYRRERKVREYDMRPLILGLRVCADDDRVIVMRLRAEPERTARADLVAAALGLPEDAPIHRTRLVLEEVPSIVLAQRRQPGLPED